MNLGTAYKRLNRFEIAVELYEESLEIVEKNYGKGCIKSSSMVHNLGVIYQNLEQYEKAVEFYEKTLGLNDKYYGNGCV